VKFSPDQFFALYRGHFGTLNQSQVDGLNALLGAAESDATITDIRWLAYMLATTYHETAHTFQPIEEIGKGRGRPYGTPDAVTGQTYYGRGFVQLTWKRNYQRFSDLLGVDLVNDPGLALEPDIAYRVMSIGMIRGLFTGKKLSDYINDLKTDYVNARRIINALDKATLIAGYAENFEKILKGALIQDASTTQAAEQPGQI
jgi:putative chitinase